MRQAAVFLHPDSQYPPLVRVLLPLTSPPPKTNHHPTSLLTQHVHKTIQLPSTHPASAANEKLYHLLQIQNHISSLTILHHSSFLLLLCFLFRPVMFLLPFRSVVFPVCSGILQVSFPLPEIKPASSFSPCISSLILEFTSSLAYHKSLPFSSRGFFQFVCIW